MRLTVERPVLDLEKEAARGCGRSHPDEWSSRADRRGLALWAMSDEDMSNLDMQRLLHDLVVDGFADFALPEERERLIQDPPPTVDALIEAISSPTVETPTSC